MIHASPEPDVEFPSIDVASFVLEGAGARADKPALIDGPSGRTITYGELEARAKGLAAGLARRGIGKGDVVAIYSPNVPEYAVAFLGVCLAGATNSTANPLYTARELCHQLRDSGARMLITVPDFLDTAREAAGEVAIDELVVFGEADGATSFDDLIEAGGEPPEVEIDPEHDLAVLPYSSGTTGLPKGVMLTHTNLVANLCQTQSMLRCGPEDVAIAVLPFFHIYGQTVIMNLGLRSGATLVTMPRFDLDQFLELTARHRATRLFVVPPVALALAKHPAIDDADLSSVRMVMCGAAPLGAELQQRVADRVGCVVLQGYGMTELSPVCHSEPFDPERVRPGSVGVTVPNTECRLVDPESGKDAEAGGRGELWIRGPQVMRGYLNNDEATAATIDSDGWLRTGDVAVISDEGYVTIVDRLKELIKYKGFQVPPAELEAILITHPAVADVAVIGVPDEEAGELPKAFVVIDGEVTDDELCEFVGTRVSPQKRVRIVERIDEIPKSPSGKILRRVLAGRD